MHSRKDDLKRLKDILTTMGGENIQIDNDTVSFDFKNNRISIIAEGCRCSGSLGYFDIHIYRVNT